MKQILILLTCFMLLISNLEAQDSSNAYRFSTEKQGIAAKFGINGNRFLGFGETKFAYKFGYNGNRYFEAGAAIAFGISSPANYSRSFIEGPQNSAGIFGTFNYTPGYFFTRLSGKFILSIEARHFYYEEYNLDNLDRTETREIMVNAKVGYGLEYKLFENFEVSIANHLNGFLRRELKKIHSDIYKRTMTTNIQISATYTF